MDGSGKVAVEASGRLDLPLDLDAADKDDTETPGLERRIRRGVLVVERRW